MNEVNSEIKTVKKIKKIVSNEPTTIGVDLSTTDDVSTINGKVVKKVVKENNEPIQFIIKSNGEKISMFDIVGYENSRWVVSHLFPNNKVEIQENEGKYNGKIIVDADDIFFIESYSDLMKKSAERTEKCIQDNISFGGASDILATAILYKFAKEGLNDE